MDLLDFLTSESNSNTGLPSMITISKSKGTRRARDILPEIPKFENTIGRLQRANRRAYQIQIIF